MPDEDNKYNKDRSGQPLSLEAQPEQGGRRFSPSAARNREVIRETFLAYMPAQGEILEIGSGTGEHGVHITALLPHLRWTFTDADAASLISARLWIRHHSREHIDRIQILDASALSWGESIREQHFAALFCANVIHISPFTVTQGMFAGAERVLSPSGRIFLYGPFARDGAMSDGNARFDLDLKRRDPAWGVRDLEADIIPIGERHGFRCSHIIPMPKNNLSVIFERRADAQATI